MESSLSADLTTRSLNFHGQQLQKLWESERGEGDLAKVGVNPKDLDFGVYQQRQKHLSFQDRGKRLKLQQFIVKKAAALFDSTLLESGELPEKVLGDEDFYAVLPPYETFLSLDKQRRVQLFYQRLKRGDIIIGSILLKSVMGSSMTLRVLCTDGENARCVSDLSIKAMCPTANTVPAVDKKGTRTYLINDTVCCEVLEVKADSEKIVVGMKGVTLPPNSEYASRLGLIHSDDFPEVYKKAQELKGETYEKVLEKSLGFYNPNNMNYLANQMGLGNNNYSHMTGLRGRFPEQEYATELRQVQASKWAFRSVAEGIEHFKSGNHSEAFQCLNKALNIDPRNVEGLVARGALYANSGSFQKAIEDFETALKLNPNHQNACKYMGETLVALGRSFEDENKFEEALKAYENCLALIPYHEEAQNSIEFLKTKILNSRKLADSEITIPGLSTSKTLEVKETLKQLLKGEDDDEKKEKEKEKSKSKKKKDRKSRKRRRRSSSSSSSSSSASSRSSSSSSSSSSDSSSASSRSGSHSRSRSPSRSRKSSKKRRKNSRKKDDKREKSQSPLSKRMALMDTSHEGEGLLAQRLSLYNPPSLPFSFGRSFQVTSEAASKGYDKDADYEQRVCRFLEQTKGDSEYEEKVRKFLEETARWKKERKALDEKAKKKKKKEKKSREKEKSKKKKREREEHEKKKKHRSNKRAEKFDAKSFEEQMESKKFRDALRKELSVKEDVRKRKSIDDEEEFLYGSGDDKKDMRLLELDNLPDLEDLETKLSAYYAKVEKDTGLSKGPEEKPEKEKKRHSASPGKVKHVSPKVMFVHHEDPKVEEAVRPREKKKMDIFAESPSPPRDNKGKLTASEAATVMASKWKMQIGSVASRLKKKDKTQADKEPWDEIEEKRYIFIKDDPEKSEGSEEEDERKKKLPVEDKFPPRKGSVSEKTNSDKVKEPLEESHEDTVSKTQQFVEKYQGGFRINARVLDKKSDDLPPLPPGVPPKTAPTTGTRGKSSALSGQSASQAKGPRTDSESDTSDSEKKKKKLQPQHSSHTRGLEASTGESSRSRSRSREKYSRASSNSSSRSRSYRKNRSRSKSGSYERRRSRSGSYGRYGSRSRSRSYPRYRSSGSRSRSRSYRSRSRSYDRYSRSRSRSEYRRSRSQSDDRRRKHDYHMNRYHQGRYPRNRGTYYRPRFQNFKNQRGGSGSGNYTPRGGRNFHKNYPQGGRRPYAHRGRGRNRGRYFHYKPGSGGYKDYHRRYEGRARSRDSDDRRSYSREDDDPMKKVDAAKEKINKYIAEENKKEESTSIPSKSRDEPLSEGEAVDDDDYGLPPLPPDGPPSRESSSNYVDRKMYEGKWADKEGDEKGGSHKIPEGPRLPPENSIEEMDKFLNKVKAQKKEEMKERNKSFSKSSHGW